MAAGDSTVLAVRASVLDPQNSALLMGILNGDAPVGRAMMAGASILRVHNVPAAADAAAPADAMVRSRDMDTHRG